MIWYVLIFMAAIGCAVNFALTKVYQLKHGNTQETGIVFNFLVGIVGFLIYFGICGFKIRITPFEILYHCNMGYPLLSENAIVKIPSTAVKPRNAHAADGIEHCLKMEKPQRGYEEKCYYHTMNGKTSVSIFNPDINKGLSINYDAAELKYFTEWKKMGEHEYVLGLEPGNCLPDGRDVMRAKGILETLEPDEERIYSITFNFTEGN